MQIYSIYDITVSVRQQSKKEGKDQESIQSNTTPDPGVEVIEQLPCFCTHWQNEMSLIFSYTLIKM